KALTIKEARDILRSNLEEVDNLQVLSDSLLELAAYHDNRFIKTTVSVPITDCITEALKRVSTLVKDKGIKIHTVLEDVVIKAHKQSLCELFVIMLDNAVKYSKENGAIDITTKTEG